MKVLLGSLQLHRGQRALFAGELERARALFVDSVQARPSWDTPRLWLALAASELGDVEQALEELREASALSPGSPVVPLFRGRVLIDHERFDEALATLEPLEAMGSCNLLLPGYLALARWASGERGDLLEDERWAPHAAWGSELLGRWLVEIEGRFPGGPGTDCFVPQEAPRTLWQRFARWRASRHLERAGRVLEGGDFLAALAALEQAEGLWFGDERAQELGQRAHLGAAKLRAQQLEAVGHDVDLRLELAEDLLEVGAAAGALAALGPVEGMIESIDADRLSWRAGAALLRGRALLALSRYQESCEALELARDLWSVEVEPLYYLAVARLRAGQRAAGRRALIEACQLDAELPSLRLREYREASR